MSADPPPSDARMPAAPSRIPVIGIVGGIGAGKSEVARILEGLGCVVSRSDAVAKAALDLPQVRGELTSWWGNGILDQHGRIDRAKVASIIFRDQRERERLEQLIHPIVHASRARTIDEAVRARAEAVIVDAPLLFEAGVDKECDAVIFVDAPEASRLQRVAETRGWAAEELSRREASQLTIKEKRRRSTHLLNNHGGLADLERNTARLLSDILAGCLRSALRERRS